MCIWEILLLQISNKQVQFHSTRCSTSPLPGKALPLPYKIYLLSPRDWFAHCLIHNPQAWLVTQTLICKQTWFTIHRQILSPKDWSAHNSFQNPETYLFTQTLICTKLDSQSREISLSPKDCFIETNFDSQSRDIHILSLKDWFEHKNDSQDHRQTFLSPKYWLATQTWFTTPDAIQKKGSIFKETDHHTNLLKP